MCLSKREKLYIGVVTSFAIGVFNYESLCLLNDTRYVHCVQVLLTVGGILHHMSFTMHIGAEIYAKCVLARQNVFRVLRKRGWVL